MASWKAGNTIEYEGHTGVIQGPGPIPGSVWVMEPNGHLCAVSTPRGNHPAAKLHVAWHEPLALAEAIRHGIVTRHEVFRYTARDFRGMPEERVVYQDTVHASTDCPQAAKGELLPNYPLGNVARRFLYNEPATAWHRHTPAICTDCIFHAPMPVKPSPFASESVGEDVDG